MDLTLPLTLVDSLICKAPGFSTSTKIFVCLSLFLVLPLYFYKNIKEVVTSSLAKEVFNLTQSYMTLIFK